MFTLFTNEKNIETDDELIEKIIEKISNNKTYKKYINYYM